MLVKQSWQSSTQSEIAKVNHSRLPKISGRTLPLSAPMLAESQPPLTLSRTVATIQRRDDTGNRPVREWVRLQRKLSVGAAGEVDEREAERVAERVVGMALPVSEGGEVALRSSYPTLAMEPDEITAVTKRCGPDSTQWLNDQMNRNRNHPVILTARETTWPLYVPFFNLGWTYGFLQDFRDLVRSGGPWDFKSNQRQWRAQAGKDCPTHDCDRTVTLCDRCFNYDVPGNIHYGWIGRQAGLRAWFLHNRADAAQVGGVDDPRDAAAIDIGIAMANNGTALCDELRQHGDELNIERTAGCNACSTS